MQKGHLEVVRLNLEMNAAGTAPMLASENGYLEVVRLPSRQNPCRTQQ